MQLKYTVLTPAKSLLVTLPTQS